MSREESSKANRSSWWKRRSRMEKWLLLVLLLLTILVIVVSVTKRSARGIDSQVCLTPSCIQTAAKVLQKVDLNIDPCEDFYNFACGNFIKNTVLPESKTTLDSFSIVSDIVDEQMRPLLEKPIKDSDSRAFVIVKSIYHACMNTEDIEAHSLQDVKQTIKDIGGWPVVEGLYWNAGLFDWTNTIYDFMKLGFNFDIFFQFSVERNSTNSSRTSLQLDQPSMPPFEKLMRRGYSEPVVQAYYNYMVKIAIAFGAEAERAQREMKDVIDFAITLTRITVPPENRRNSSLEDNSYTIRELEEQFSYVPWLQYINVMLNPLMTMSYNNPVTVTLPQYFKELETVINSTLKRTMANYMYWTIIENLISYLSDEVRNIELRFLKISSGISEREPRWRHCVQTSKDILIASGAFYVRHIFKKEAKEPVIEMVENMQKQFKEVLKNVDWMDGITRKHALKKVEAMYAHIAYPDELLDDRKTNEYFRNLTVHPRRYLQSMLNVSLFDWQVDCLKLAKSVIKKEWTNHASSSVTNAFYDQNDNSIEFPAGVLQDVFFDNQRPQYMNYGAIGYIIGHEITHGFDDEGRQFDKDGNLVDWWQPKTKSAFDAKAECIIDQYSNITVPEINLNLNGMNTQGENIADNGGIKIAYLAYKNWVNKHHPELSLPGLSFTPKQMFWVSAAHTWCTIHRREDLKIFILNDPHPPSRYRVNVPFMNSEYFSKDFNCKVGSRMNPTAKCRIW